jgi:hypothetical protein
MNTIMSLSAVALSTMLAYAVPAAPAEPPSAEVLFSDEFSGKLGDGWRWVREDPATWRVGANGLEVRVLPGNMWGGANNARNVLVRPVPVPLDAPVEISVTISNAPTGQWEQVDLAWFYDDGHMVKLGQELVTGRLSIVMGREEADRARTIGIVPLDALAVELRLQAFGNRVRGQFRTAAWRDWREVGDCDLPVKGEPKASLQFYQGLPNVEHWARVSRFAVRRLPGAGVDWPRAREAEKSVQSGGAGEPLTRLTLPGGLELVNDMRALGQAGKPDSQQRIYLHRDGTCGWSWDRRGAGIKQPTFCGTVLGATAFNQRPVGGFTPIAVADLKSFELDSHTVTRLENDAGDHSLALGVCLSSSEGTPSQPTDEMVIWFDWYGPAFSVQTLKDGHRDYGLSSAPSEAGAVPRQHVYRIAGFRGAPPHVNLKAFLEDLAQREPNRSWRILGAWFGNQVWDGSRGATLVTRLDWIINGQRYEAVPAKGAN